MRIDEYPHKEIDVDAFSAIFVHSDLKRIGNFECGNKKVNRLYRNRFDRKCVFAYSTQLVIQAGEVWGKDVSSYKELHKNILAVFRKEYLEDMLCCDLDITKTADHLGGKMSTGFVGTPYLLHTLSESGRVDDAYKLLFNEDPPSWLYSVNKGATTMWEHWNGIKEDGAFWSADMNSFNHYAYEAIGDWLYGVVAGIKTAEPGYKKVILAPQPDQRLGYVTSSVQTPYGELLSSWKHVDGIAKYKFIIPEGITANIILPNGYQKTVCGGGQIIEV